MSEEPMTLLQLCETLEGLLDAGAMTFDTAVAILRQEFSLTDFGAVDMLLRWREYA